MVIIDTQAYIIVPEITRQATETVTWLQTCGNLHAMGCGLASSQPSDNSLCRCCHRGASGAGSSRSDAGA
jgi:hypothetical protein